MTYLKFVSIQRPKDVCMQSDGVYLQCSLGSFLVVRAFFMEPLCISFEAI